MGTIAYRAETCIMSIRDRYRVISQESKTMKGRGHVREVFASNFHRSFAKHRMQTNGNKNPSKVKRPLGNNLQLTIYGNDQVCGKNV